MCASKRTALKLLSFALIAPAAQSSISQISNATASNRAGRFRALSQRCLKAYCQLQQ